MSRGVVVEAYRRLTDEGLVTSRVGAGTVVASRARALDAAPPSAPTAPAAAVGEDVARLPARPPAGIDVDLSPGVPDQVVVVSGVAQSLALLAHVLRSRGRPSIAQEDPGSGVRARASPTGVVLAPQRRRRLQAGAPDHVVHTGSTSKTLAPGLRLGWVVAPAGLRADVVAAKRASDLGSPALPQLVLAELLTSGAYDRHVRLVRARQRARRAARQASSCSR